MRSIWLQYLSSDGINEFNESLVTQPTEYLIEPCLLCRDLETGPLHDPQVFEDCPVLGDQLFVMLPEGKN